MFPPWLGKSMTPAPAPSAPALPAPPAAQGFTSRGLLGLAAVFLGTVAAAWAWFHVGAATPADALRFDVRTDIPGWAFVPEDIPPRAQELLATTNLVNGVFRAAGGREVVVFAGEWHADNAHQMSVVNHTPDLCWVKVGWVPAALGQPQKLVLPVGGREIPFECRVFQAPGGQQRQLVVWTTVLGGRVVEEGDRFQAEDVEGADRRERRATSARRLAAAHFTTALRERIPGTGFKQFIRFSVPLEADWQEAAVAIKDFAPRWLDLVHDTKAPSS